jgi:L-alanine-DL-glutamate epimerase-like enolase superfamily enzyme
LKIDARPVSYALKEPFRTSAQTYYAADVIEVAITVDRVTGYGEAAGVDYDGETQETMIAQIGSVTRQLETSPETALEDLQCVLGPGGARNAIDAALWDVRAKRAQASAFEIAGIAPASVRTAITIGMETPEVAERNARTFAAGALIKLKLGDALDLDRLRAVRAGAPDADLIVDANQGWRFDDMMSLKGALVEARVLLVEQPLAVEDDDALLGCDFPIPLCADESCSDRASLPALIGKYDVINIKLDKTGGLTEALALAAAASDAGLQLMVGCMGGSSLCIAPAMIVAQFCAFVDLDCPLQLCRDVDHGLVYNGDRIGMPSPTLWG